MCTNREVETIGVKKELNACSLFREKEALHLRSVI